MNKPLVLTAAALVISLGLNTWQLLQRAPGDPAASPTPGPSRKADRPGGAPEFGSGSAHPSRARTPGELTNILAVRDPMARLDALMAFVKELPAHQIGEVMEQLQAGADKWDPEFRLLAHLLLTRWTQEDPEAALASLERRSKREGADAYSILSSLAATDPGRAAAWLNEPDNWMAQLPKLAPMLARTVGEQWALQDPDAAMQWAAGLPDRQRAGAYSGIIGNLAGTDPQRAAELAMTLDPGDREELLGEIAERWALQSPAEAVAWAGSLEGDERSRALSDALGAWAQTAPEAAAAFIDQLPEAEQPDHVSRVARSWSDQSPAEAAAWLGSQPENDGKTEAMGYVMWDWTNADPEAAATWLGEQESGPSYDHGVSGLAKAAAHVYQDGEAGVSWASTIENEQLRSTMINHTLGQWVREDPEAARSWATEHNVPVPKQGSGGK